MVSKRDLRKVTSVRQVASIGGTKYIQVLDVHTPDILALRTFHLLEHHFIADPWRDLLLVHTLVTVLEHYSVDHQNRDDQDTAYPN